MGSSLEATKVCGGGKMSEPSKHRARKARGEEKQEEREEADWRGYTTAGDPQPQLNLQLYWKYIDPEQERDLEAR